MLGQFLTSFMGTVINIAVAPISRAFGHAVDDGEWLVLAYLLALAPLLSLLGRIGDLFGHKRVYVLGFAVLGVADGLCAFAPGFWPLVAFRAAAGVGGALLSATASAIVTEAFPTKMRGRALGINGAAVAVGLTIGPFAGGYITSALGWRYVFLLTIPFAIVGTIWPALVLRRGIRRPERFDVPGALLSALTLLALCLALSRAHVWGYTSPWTLGSLAVAVVAGIAFVAAERRSAAPMIDLTLFENRIFAFSVCASVLYYTATNAVIFTLPIELQAALGMSPFEAGLALTPLALAVIFLAPIAGALSDRISARYLSSLGVAIIGISSLVLTSIDAHSTIAQIMARVTLVGVGIGFFNQPNNSTIMGNAPRERLGTAAGILATARTTGNLFGTALAGAVYFFRVAQLGADALHGPQPAIAVYVGVAFLAAVAVVVSYARG